METGYQPVIFPQISPIFVILSQLLMFHYLLLAYVSSGHMCTTDSLRPERIHSEPNGFTPTGTDTLRPEQMHSGQSEPIPYNSNTIRSYPERLKPFG